MKYLNTIAIFTLLTIICCSSQNNDQTKENELVEFSKIDFSNSYQINDDKYGTKTTVGLKNDKRIMSTNALPNHPTGNFPNEENPNRITPQNIEYSLPLTPKLSGESRWVREPGVALNRVKFEPETAERFVCETGEVYKIEAIQELLKQQICKKMK